MTAREQAEMHIFGQTVGKEIGDALIDGDVRRLTKTIQSAILAEREACAKICDDERLALFKSRKPGDDASVYKVRAWQIGDIAAAIRARSNAPEEEKVRAYHPHGYQIFESVAPESSLNKLSLKENVMPPNYEPIYYPKKPVPESPKEAVESSYFNVLDNKYHPRPKKDCT